MQRRAEPASPPRIGTFSALALVTILSVTCFGLLHLPDDLHAEQQQELPLADVFSPPLGFHDGLSYNPRITYDGEELIQNTDYGVMNPELAGGTCFGMAWRKTYHAGVDLYRDDEETTAEAEVTAVADGQVVYANPFTNYPGLVVIIEHRLPSNEMIYSVYSHLEYDTLAVEAGDIITRGHSIGTVLYTRYTGRFPELNPSGEDDSHLHFEMRYFHDGSDIYDEHPPCNGIVPGRGYTYPERPDDFPTPSTGYTNPSSFIEARSPGAGP
jgi:murein DD-endopeptidase MepM/ murein hydrolase activator NlpD